MRRGMILLGFWMCVCMVFLVNAQEIHSVNCIVRMRIVLFSIGIVPRWNLRNRYP